MKKIFFISLAAAAFATVGCSDDSGDSKVKVEHTVQVRFVDTDGNNLFDNQTYDDDAIKIVTYDNDGNEQDFYNGDWFAVHGWTVDRYYGRYVFTIYLTLPEAGEDVTETYMRFFGTGPDIFTAEYEIREGKRDDEPYGGGTVRVKRVRFNGELIWDRENRPEGPVDIVKELPVV